jgi:predicted RNA-binding protein with PIN domain
MAFLLIDGYNLIGTAHRDLEKARNNLVSKLSKYSAQNGHDITVVFDGWKDGQARMVRQGKQDYEQAILQLSIQELLKMLIQLSKES